MNRLYVLIYTILSTISISAAYADSPGWVGPSTVEKILIQDDRIFVRLGTQTLNLNCPDGGSGKNDGWFQLNLSAILFKEQYSLLLSSQARAAPTNVFLEGCGYYPIAKEVMVSK